MKKHWLKKKLGHQEYRKLTYTHILKQDTGVENTYFKTAVKDRNTIESLADTTRDKEKEGGGYYTIIQTDQAIK